MKVKAAAILTIHRIPDMTRRGRRRVSDWLRNVARDIEREPEAYAKTFRARYLYTKKGAV